MKKPLQDWFIPVKNNNYKPYLLRKESLTFVLALIIFVELVLFSQFFSVIKNADFIASVLPSVLVNLANRERITYQIKILSTNPLLEKAAQLKANDMATKGYFSHTSPEGKTPWYWIDLIGYSYLYAGENLAVNFFESSDVEQAWMNSPAHRANIINDKYTEMGIATAQGMYKGQLTTFVVEFFGQPSAVPVIPPESKVISSEPKAVSASVGVVNQPDKIVVSNPLPEPIKSASPVKPNVKGQEISIQPQNNIPWQRSLSSSKILISLILLALLAAIIILTLLAIFIEIKIQHPKMIMAAFFLILLIVGTLFINSRLIISKVEVPTDTNNSASSFLEFSR